MDARRRSETVLAAIAALASLLFVALVPASVALHRAPLDRGGPSHAGAAWPATLSVVVLRAAGGTPIVGATVRAFWANRREYSLVASQRTDATGRADLGSLPTGAAWVLVDAPGFARRSTALVLGQGARRVSVALDPGGELQVRVEDESKTPVREATVLVTGADALPFGALTDAQGMADLAHLARGPWKLRVLARGYEPEARSDVVAAVTVTLRRASVLDVSVVDADGHPRPGATVLVGGPSLWPARRLFAGEDGHSRVTGLESGTYDLKAEYGALVSKTELGLHLERGEAHALTLVVAPGRMIPLVVTDGEGDHPILVPNADVVLVEGGVSSFPIQGRTGTLGTVTLGPIAPGHAVVSARADGFVPHATVPVPEVIAGEVRIPLLRGATLRGEVVDGDGRPIDGATVEVIGTDLDGMPIAATPLVADFQRAHFEWALAGPAPLLPGGELGVMPGPIPPIPRGPAGPSESEGRLVTLTADAEPWVTSLDGTFKAAPIPPGRVRALVRHPSYVEATSDMVILTPGSVGRVRVVLRGGGAVEGAVVDEAGLPVAGARVEVLAVQGTLGRTTITADDGTFAFAALPAQVQISLSRPDEPYRPVVRRRLEVPEGRTSEVSLVLPALRDPVELTAEDDSRRPVKMAQITALSLDPERPLRTTAFTDDAGRASIRDARGLPLLFLVEAPGFARWSRQVDAAPADLAVELVSGVLIEGTITAVRGRRDVEGATVELLAEGHRRSATTDALGRYRFGEVSPGSARLTVSHADYATEEVEIAVQSTGRSDRALDIPPIDLVEPGAVTGRVVDREGRPVAGARVGVGTVAAYLPLGALVPATATTRPDGTFRLERLRPRKADLEAYAAGVGRGRVKGVAVDEGRTTEDVTIQIEASGDDKEPSATGGVAITLAESVRGGAAELRIVQVAAGSEAEHAGIEPGDLLEQVDRTRATSIDDARLRLAGPDGSDVVVQVLRQGKHLGLRIRRERVRR